MVVEELGEAAPQPGAILRVTLDTNHWLTAGALCLFAGLTRPTANAPTRSMMAIQVQACQIPRSFSRIAVRCANIWAFRRSSFGNVSSTGDLLSSGTEKNSVS